MDMPTRISSPARPRPLPLVRRAFESLVSLLAPDVCAACDERTPIMTIFCPSCAATLERATDTSDDDIAPFVYGGALAIAIASLKYEERLDRARPLSHLLLGAIEPLRRDPPSHVVPVPLHRARAARRGFNQAALLAAPVARALGARFAASALRRTRETQAQATLPRASRIPNVEDAFVARRRIEGARVLLVDDVRTTGATLAACARALRAAGARDVRTLVLACAE
jgi:ComF family protein